MSVAMAFLRADFPEAFLLLAAIAVVLAALLLVALFTLRY
jgi:hypothetical protein